MLKVAWSIGHDPLHPGAFCQLLGETEHNFAKEVVRNGIDIINGLKIGWEVFNPSDHVTVENKSAGQVLHEKIKLINQWKADIAIESHFNSSSNSQANGCETIYFAMPGVSGSADGKRFAEMVQKSTLEMLNQSPMRRQNLELVIKDRGAKGMASIKRMVDGKETFPRLAFLMQTKMPAVILEPLFISSPHDIEGLKDARGEECHRLGVAVVRALLRYEALRL